MRIIGGSKKNHTLVVPKGSITRPTSARLRETLFNICQNDVPEARFLDLFAGSGAMGLEALSRGAASSVFVDKSKESIAAIRSNIRELKFENLSTIIQGDVFLVLKQLEKKMERFDLIYVDPPYTLQGNFEGSSCRSSYSDKIVEFIDASTLLLPGGFLFIEDCNLEEFDVAKLQKLTLVSSRRAGRASLKQYQM